LTAGPQSLVFIHPSDELYGADRMLLEVLEALPEGVQAEVWLPTDLEHPSSSLCTELTRRGIANRHVDLPILRRAYRTPRTLAALARRALRLRAELRSARPSVVYCTTSAAFIAAPVARVSGVSQVIGHLQEIWSGGDRRLLAPLARSCHRLLAISDAVRDVVPGALRDRCVVVPNATPEPDGVVDATARTGPIRYVVASRWNVWKGHRTLLGAWDRVEAPGHLTILGGPPGSGDSVDVPELVAQLRHPDSVTIVGEVDEPAPYLEAADVVVMPSDQPEPFGLIAIEAFARHRPVIGSAAGGLVDIVTTGVDGWLYPIGDVDALAGVLSEITREAVGPAGARARATYLERYTTEIFRHRWRAAVELGF
jgi:glycosyltransferase involved in cell wall biosynthesis